VVKKIPLNDEEIVREEGENKSTFGNPILLIQDIKVLRQIHISDAQENIVSIVSRQRSVN